VLFQHFTLLGFIHILVTQPCDSQDSPGCGAQTGAAPQPDHRSQRQVSALMMVMFGLRDFDDRLT
jgi:hypothetical protein